MVGPAGCMEMCVPPTCGMGMTPVWQAPASGAGTALSTVLTASKATAREQDRPPAPLGTHTCPGVP